MRLEPVLDDDGPKKKGGAGGPERAETAFAPESVGPQLRDFLTARSRHAPND
jgi:hypothetical protein